MVVGLTMWALQRAWAWISGGQEMRVSSALMMSWGILLEDPPNVLPANVTSQVLVGWWWVFCMLITATYRSSLIAHLSVPDKSPTIDTLDQLLEEDGWTWGMEPTYGVGWQWFKESSVPTVQKVNQRIEVLDAEEHLALVLQGRHAFLTWKYYIRTIIASSYTNARGYTPTYTGRSEYINYGGYGWGFRKGAPFRERIDAVKQRLLQGGLINYWMNELILTSSREARKNNSMEDTAAQVSERVVLGLGQLQGAFYLLILGYVAAAFTLLAETITNKFFRNAGQFPNTSLLPPLRR
ncbi:Glutamate receptor ionotropic, kainate 2-like 2 [Homarus americanus]|uniref:Glutamate receptor ionotropic, kainate 2-like 2 n=2 Tax=Homarus americanus TaxID=6706 RepID=A0A8J5NBI5_HOMAM|nr:Glutamate receptor ionotropic, kainate 2-like 2 [Homarus americanus]